MEYSNLSLIENSGDDDSLLQPSPLSSSSPPLSLFSTTNFSTKGETISQVHASVITYSNKENHNKIEDKSGVPSLSVEPQKMKRSRKAGGYNLRKSLAWDRAFLTEEGVLNDSELSMIAGATGDRDHLSVIDEQGRDSLPMNSSIISDSADLETLEEDLFKELPSGYPNKRNDTCSSFVKQDSLSGCCLASASKSTRKVSGHCPKKVLCKGEVYSSPVACTSQKRSMNTSTRQNMTRNSKIPKFPAPKKNPSVPSTTAIQTPAGGSSLKCTGIPQPARESLCSKSSSKFKQSAKASLETIPKPVKSCVNVENDAKKSTMKMHSLISNKTQDTNKVRKYPKYNSRQDLLTGVANVAKSSDGKSNTTTLSQVHSDNSGPNKKNVQPQGIKPSGLRMPSPSLRFFSETKAPVSNTSSQANSLPPNLLKFSIPQSSISISRDPEVAYHNHDFKPTQLLHGVPNVDSMTKAGSFQKTDTCSTSSIVTHIVNSKVVQDKCNPQVEVQVPLEDKNFEAINKEQCRYDNLDGFEKQHKDQVPTSLKVEEKNIKTKKLVSSYVEFEEGSHKATILFHENGTVDRGMLDCSCKPCPEAQLIVACETNTEVQAQIEDVEHNSSVTKNVLVLESQTNLNSHHEHLMLPPDIDPSSSFHRNRAPGECNSCGLDQVKTQRSAKVQLDDSNMLADEKSSIYLDEREPAVPIWISCVMAVQESIISNGATEICNANCSVEGESNYKHVDDEVEVIFDCKLSSMKHIESSEKLDEAIPNHDKQQRSSTNTENYDGNDINNVDLKIMEPSNQYTSTLQESPNEDSVDLYNFCSSDQDEEKSKFSRNELAGDCASSHCKSVSSNHCTNNIEGTYTEVDKQQNLNSKLLNNELMLQRNEAELMDGIASQDSSYKINAEKSDVRSSDDIDTVNNSTKEVKDQTDLLSCLPDNSNINDSTVQMTHLQYQSAGMRSNDQVEIAVANPDTEEPLYPTNFELYIESDEHGHDISPGEYRLKNSQHVDGLTVESTHSAEDVDDEDMITKQGTDGQKLARPPPDAVPFSDEWLAAIESAGEEILTLKTGAVKHSPPDKSIPEPGPWSPVKRKNAHVIGPYDCTKYTNM